MVTPNRPSARICSTMSPGSCRALELGRDRDDLPRTNRRTVSMISAPDASRSAVRSPAHAGGALAHGENPTLQSC